MERAIRSGDKKLGITIGLGKDGRNGRLLLQYYSKIENPKNFFIPSL